MLSNPQAALQLAERKKIVELLKWSAPVALLGAALGALYAPVFLDVWPTWLNDEYSSHCLFVPVLVGLLIYWKRGEVAGAVKTSSPAGFAWLAVGLAMEVLSWYTQTRIVMILSLIPVLAGLVLILMGSATLRIVRVPLMLLGFLAPLPPGLVAPISAPIQVVSTRTACQVAAFVGIPFVQEGFHVSLPRVSVEIVESCSGFKGTVTLVLFCVFYASLFDIPISKRALLVLLAVPLAIAVNVLRIDLIILSGYWWGEKGVHLVHDGSAWAGLAAGFGVLMLLGKALKCGEPRFIQSLQPARF